MKLMGMLVSILAISLFSAGPARAQGATWLTEGNIRAFLEESASSYMIPFEDHARFLQKTTHLDYQGKINLVVHMPDQTPAHTPMVINKEDMLASAREGYDSVQGATVQQTIDSIKISPDKKSAVARSKLRITNQTISTENSMQSTLADSETTCTDEFIYTPKIGVQLLKSDCQSDIIVKQEQEL